MRLHDYLKKTPARRAVIASAAGVSVGHINNVAYGLRACSSDIATQIEGATDGEVMRWDLRPDDWHVIWPELMARDGAPTVLQDREAA